MCFSLQESSKSIDKSARTKSSKKLLDSNASSFSLQESSKSIDKSARTKSSKKLLDSNASSLTSRKRLPTAETTPTPVKGKTPTNIGKPAKKPKLNFDEKVEQGTDDSVSKEKERDDFKENDQLRHCQDDPHSNTEDCFHSDSEEPCVIPNSQISERSVRRRSLPLVRTTDTVHSSNKLNKTFTISSACPEFDEITHRQDVGNEKTTKPRGKIKDSKDKMVVEKEENATIVNSDITTTGDSNAIPWKGLKSEGVGVYEECSVVEISESQDPVSQTPNTSSKPKRRKKMRLSDSLDYSFLDDDVNDMYSQIKNRRRETRRLSDCQYYMNLDSEDTLSQSIPIDASQKQNDIFRGKTKREKRDRSENEDSLVDDSEKPPKTGTSVSSLAQANPSETEMNSGRFPLVLELKHSVENVTDFTLPDSQFAQLKLHSLDSTELVPESKEDATKEDNAASNRTGKRQKKPKKQSNIDSNLEVKVSDKTRKERLVQVESNKNRRRSRKNSNCAPKNENYSVKVTETTEELTPESTSGSRRAPSTKGRKRGRSQKQAQLVETTKNSENDITEKVAETTEELIPESTSGSGRAPSTKGRKRGRSQKQAQLVETTKNSENDITEKVASSPPNTCQVKDAPDQSQIDICSTEDVNTAKFTKKRRMTASQEDEPVQERKKRGGRANSRRGGKSRKPGAVGKFKEDGLDDGASKLTMIEAANSKVNGNAGTPGEEISVMLGLSGEFEVEFPPAFLSALPNDWYEGSEDGNADDTGTTRSARKCNRNRNTGTCNVICANSDQHKVTPHNKSGKVYAGNEPRHTNDSEDTSCESQRTDGSDTVTSQSKSHIDCTSLRKVLDTDISNSPYCKENEHKYVEKIQRNSEENRLINQEVSDRKESKTEDIVLTIGSNKVKAVGKTSQRTKRRKKCNSKSMEIQDSNSKVTSPRNSGEVEFSESTDKQEMRTRENTTVITMDSNEKEYQDKQGGNVVIECNEERLSDGNEKIARGTTGNNKTETDQLTTEQMGIIGTAIIIEMPKDSATQVTKKLSVDMEEITTEDGNISTKKTDLLAVENKYKTFMCEAVGMKSGMFKQTDETDQRDALKDVNLVSLTTEGKDQDLACDNTRFEAHGETSKPKLPEINDESIAWPGDDEFALPEFKNDDGLLSESDSETEEQKIKPVLTDGFAYDTTSEETEFALQVTPELQDFLQHETEDEEEFALADDIEMISPVRSEHQSVPVESDDEEMREKRMHEYERRDGAKEKIAKMVLEGGSDQPENSEHSCADVGEKFEEIIIKHSARDETEECEFDDETTEIRTELIGAGKLRSVSGNSEKISMRELTGVTTYAPITQTVNLQSSNACTVTGSTPCDNGAATIKTVHATENAVGATQQPVEKSRYERDSGEAEVRETVSIGNSSSDEENKGKCSSVIVNIEGNWQNFEESEKDHKTWIRESEDQVLVANGDLSKEMVEDADATRVEEFVPTDVEQRNIPDNEYDDEIVIQNNYDKVISSGDGGIQSRDEDSTPQPEDRPTLEEYEIAQADSGDSDENLMDDDDDDDDLNKSIDLNGNIENDQDGQDEQRDSATLELIQLEQRIMVR